MDRVLFAADDSVESLAAIRYGARLAAEWNASIRILTSVPDAADPERRTEAMQLLEHDARAMRSAGIPAERIDTVVRTGEAFRCILDEARTWRADLIVMAVSHHSGLRSPYVGSQTEHVLEFTACPVLVIPNSPASST
jgi:nucleotide-binding universal stress UspA family protein